MDERSRMIGQRVKAWRTRRGLTRQQFADLVGRSLSWVDKVEAGERSLLRLTILELVADVLSVAPQVLMDDDAASRAEECPDAAEVLAIKSALGRYDATISHGQDDDRAAPDLPRLTERVQHASLAWFAAHYRTLGRVLPGLIVDAQQATETLAGDQRAKPFGNWLRSIDSRPRRCPNSTASTSRGWPPTAASTSPAHRGTSPAWPAPAAAWRAL